RIEPHRLSVGHARGLVPIADDDVAGGKPLVDPCLVFEAIRDVEQLHDFGPEVTFALQGSPDLDPDCRFVVGEGKRPDHTALCGQHLAEIARLRFLAALIETLEGDEHQISNWSMSSTV